MKTSIKPVAVQHFTADGRPCLSLEISLEMVVGAAQSKCAYEDAVQALRGSLDWAHHTQLRAAYVAELRAHGRTVEAANKAWERFCSACGYKAPKSQSKAAAAKRAARAKLPKVEKPAKPEPVAPASGKAAAGGLIQMDLTPLESNIVKWFREGKFAMIESAITAAMAK